MDDVGREPALRWATPLVVNFRPGRSLSLSLSCLLAREMADSCPLAIPYSIRSATVRRKGEEEEEEEEGEEEEEEEEVEEEGQVIVM